MLRFDVESLLNNNLNLKTGSALRPQSVALSWRKVCKGRKQSTEVGDNSVLDRVFTVSRSRFYAMHTYRITLLHSSIQINFFSCDVHINILIRCSNPGVLINCFISIADEFTL